MSANAPFPISPFLTGIAVSYRNSRLIADEVLPRVPVGVQEFKYTKYAKEDSFTIPDTKIGRTSRPNEVEFGGSEQTSATRDYGLEDPIPQADIDNSQGTQFNPLARGTELLTDLILLDREKRTGDLVFNAASYATGNKTTLAGVTQWSDATSDPVSAILNALDSMIVRPNIAVFGRAVFTKLIQHSKIVAAAIPLGGNADKGGIVTRQAIANLFELDDVQVGEGWVNTAKKGQAPNLVRVWGKHAAFLVRNPLATPNSGLTFGFTAQFGGRVAGSRPDENIGLRGGQRVRVGESVKELITANDLGYFFQDAVA